MTRINNRVSLELETLGKITIRFSTKSQKMRRLFLRELQPDNFAKHLATADEFLARKQEGEINA